MKKLRSLPSLLIASFLSGIFALDSAIAEEKLQTSDIHNDLLRASLGAKSSDPAVANKVINESDLEIANKKLMAAEARLLEKANIPSESVNPVLPSTNSVPKANPVMQEKNLAPEAAPNAALDINKVIAAIDRTSAESNQPASAVANAPVQPAPAVAPVVNNEQASNKAQTELEGQLAATIEKNNQLIKELDDTRNRLMIAETQVERLSSIIESSGRPKNNSGREVVDANAALSVSRSRQIQRLENDGDMESDMQIAVVTADKVHLRTGPGKENSPLMAVTRGTRLAVETRNGEWYRVIAPTGARAWVSQDVISFSTADKIKGSQIVGFNG